MGNIWKRYTLHMSCWDVRRKSDPIPITSAHKEKVNMAVVYSSVNVANLQTKRVSKCFPLGASISLRALDVVQNCSICLIEIDTRCIGVIARRV